VSRAKPTSRHHTQLHTAKQASRQIFGTLICLAYHPNLFSIFFCVVEAIYCCSDSTASTSPRVVVDVAVVCWVNSPASPEHNNKFTTGTGAPWVRPSSSEVFSHPAMSSFLVLRTIYTLQTPTLFNLNHHTSLARRFKAYLLRLTYLNENWYVLEPFLLIYGHLCGG
jgi:hypothetical protein